MTTYGFLLLGLLELQSADNQVFCKLIDPPPGSRLIDIHGQILAIFPESSVLDDDFTGCQSEWIYLDWEWKKVSTTVFSRGLALRYEMLDRAHGFECSYEDQKLVTKNHDCPTFDAVNEKTPSMEWACIELNVDGSYRAMSCSQ